MREGDTIQHPAAVARTRRAWLKFYGGAVVACAGLVTVFLFHEIYVGFAMALVGFGVVPFEKLGDLFKR